MRRMVTTWMLEVSFILIWPYFYHILAIFDHETIRKLKLNLKFCPFFDNFWPYRAKWCYLLILIIFENPKELQFFFVGRRYEGFMYSSSRNLKTEWVNYEVITIPPRPIYFLLPADDNFPVKLDPYSYFQWRPLNFISPANILKVG